MLGIRVIRSKAKYLLKAECPILAWSSEGNTITRAGAFWKQAFLP